MDRVRPNGNDGAEFIDMTAEEPSASPSDAASRQSAQQRESQPEETAAQSAKRKDLQERNRLSAKKCRDKKKIKEAEMAAKILHLSRIIADERREWLRLQAVVRKCAVCSLDVAPANSNLPPSAPQNPVAPYQALPQPAPAQQPQNPVAPYQSTAQPTRAQQAGQRPVVQASFGSISGPGSDHYPMSGPTSVLSHSRTTVSPALPGGGHRFAAVMQSLAESERTWSARGQVTGSDFGPAGVRPTSAGLERTVSSPADAPMRAQSLNTTPHPNGLQTSAFRPGNSSSTTPQQPPVTDMNFANPFANRHLLGEVSPFDNVPLSGTPLHNGGPSSDLNTPFSDNYVFSASPTVGSTADSVPRTLSCTGISRMYHGIIFPTQLDSALADWKTPGGVL